MFALATKTFVEEVDNGGLLIPVSSLNDDISLLTVVVKRKRFWFWQKPRYLPADFILSDLLTGDTPLMPAVVEKDFLKYSGTFGDSLQGTVDASFAKSSVNVEGKDTSKLQSSFGSLKKEEVDVQKLLQDCRDRVLDMTHCLIQQTKEQHKQVFGIVKERIVTTQACSVIEEVQQGGQCGGSLGPCGPKNHKFSLKENGSLNTDSNITMEIPTNTVLAYGLLELEVRQDGRFELCLMSGTKGGFEKVDGPATKKELLGVSGARTSVKRELQQQLEQLKEHFQVLSALPASTRASLLQQISELLQDPAAIRTLQIVLDRMRQDEEPGWSDAGGTGCQQQKIQEILHLLELLGEAERGRTESLLLALHLIISALDEMTEGCVAVLRTCSSPPVLQSLELLVRCVSGDGEMTWSGADLTEELYEMTRRLFANSHVCLRRDGDVLRTEIRHQPGNLPLVLCIAIRGLASLAHT
ncbi:gasdermin Eb [Austrofundulus limnaeus]|uniref:Gasdermin Eb n=1 Tax=Austrofundulus limnaeus TaxID=52670 RepID=A0A2I4B930_AUSLI|nr:PREDICTED: non-syndromic hearing impairment protein 5-like [Austrofundulus limnaeus]